MLIYSKVVEGVKKLFYSTTDIPTADDAEVTYRDAAGNAYTPTVGDTYVDAGSKEGIKRIKAIIGNTVVNVYCGDVCIIGDGAEPAPVTVTKIEITTEATKKVYAVDENLETEGLVITATYSDGTTAVIEEKDYECSPADGAKLTEVGEVTVTITYEEKTTSYTVTVGANENEE